MFSYILCAEECSYLEGYIVKDLSKMLPSREADSIIVVDVDE